MSKKAGYICPTCATKEGCVWPKGRRATHFYGECDYCYSKQPICSDSHWVWPADRDAQLEEEA